MRVASLHLDAKNPRLGRQVGGRAPREIVQYLFDHDKALEVAESIATRGFFPNEPLLAVKEGGDLVVIEGNRRLAALKALREPGLLEGRLAARVEKLAKRLPDIDSIAEVPVTLAPSRRATDKQVAARHIGSPVLAWEMENRASFILEKLGEGYTTDQLRDELGFSLSDVQKARQTRAIADMARSLELPEEVKAKLDNPRAKVYTTLERVFDSSIGRRYLRVQPDAEHGIKGTTTSREFKKGFTRLVSDVALGKASSRSLNTNEDIQKYFEDWEPEARVADKKGSFVPSEIIAGKSVASADLGDKAHAAARRVPQPSKTVVPKAFKVRVASERLRDIRDELVKLNRDDFPNAGAVLLRVFFELAALDYLGRTGELAKIVAELKAKGKLKRDVPDLKDLRPRLVNLAKSRLSKDAATRVEKAIRVDRAAPFGLDDLHAFVHQAKEFPTGASLKQFWERTEPLFQMMLEESEGR